MRYLDIVPKEQIEYTSTGVVIDNDDANRYEPLRRIAYPANNGHGDWTETVVVTHADGEVEKVRGHIVGSGHVDGLEGER